MLLRNQQPLLHLMAEAQCTTARCLGPVCLHFNAHAISAGIRVPANGFIRDVCRLHGGALALSSANISGGRSPIDVSELRELWPQCTAVFDGGTLRGGGRHGSTIIDLSERGCFRIVRRGSDQLAAEYAQQCRAVFRLEQKK